MSLIEDQNRAHNEQAVKDREVAAKEHLVEMERLRLLEESYKNPALIAFRKRREEQVLRHRHPKT